MSQLIPKFCCWLTAFTVLFLEYISAIPFRSHTCHGLGNLLSSFFMCPFSSSVHQRAPREVLLIYLDTSPFPSFMRSVSD